MAPESLQWLNIFLTSGLYLAVIAAAVKYGRLIQKVEDHGERINKIEERIEERLVLRDR